MSSVRREPPSRESDPSADGCPSWSDRAWIVISPPTPTSSSSAAASGQSAAAPDGLDSLLESISPSIELMPTSPSQSQQRDEICTRMNRQPP